MKPLNFLSIFFLIFFVYFHSFSQIESVKKEEIFKELNNYFPEDSLTKEEISTILLSKGIDIENQSLESLAIQQDEIRNILEDYLATKRLNKNKGTSNLRKASLILNEGSISQTFESKNLGSEIIPIIENSREDSLGKQGKEIYGHQQFKNYYASVINDITPRDHYILSKNDLIEITISGRTQFYGIFEINSAGFINPEGLPKIFLSGKSWSDSKKEIQKVFSNYFSFNPSQLLINLKASKTVNVRVMGEVMNPGNYSVSSVNSVLNVLAKAGGFSPKGSLRSIQIIRNGKRIYVDLYKAIQNPFGDFDPYVQENDLIFVPLYQKQVYISEAVKRPGFYELKEEEGLKDLIELSGGVTGEFSGELVHVEGVRKGEKLILDYSYQDIIQSKVDAPLMDLDNIRFPGYSNLFENYVEILGGVEYPGKYEFSTTPNLFTLFSKAKPLQDIHVSDLVIQRIAVDKHEEFIHLDSTFFQEANAKKFLLQKGDRIMAYKQKDYLGLFKVSIGGQVKKDTSFAIFSNDIIPFKSLLTLAKGYSSQAIPKGYLIHRNPFNDYDVSYSYINLDTDFSLKAGDSLIVLNKKDFSFDFEVVLSGEVNQSGIYKYTKDLKFADLMRLSGGNTVLASKRVDLYRYQVDQYGYGSFLKKELILKDNFLEFQNEEDLIIQPYDRFVVRPKVNAYVVRSVTIKGQINKPGEYYFGIEPYYFSDLMKDSDGLLGTADKNSVRVIKSSIDSVAIQFSYTQSIQNPHNPKFDPQLQNGDIVEIGPYTNLVKIYNFGVKNVAIDTNYFYVNYSGNYSAKWYINNFAGGFDNEVDKNSLYVQKANGRNISLKKFLFFKIYPTIESGDQIRLTKIKEKIPDSEKKGIDWDKTFNKILTLSTSVSLVYFYIRQAK